MGCAPARRLVVEEGSDTTARRSRQAAQGVARKRRTPGLTGGIEVVEQLERYVDARELAELMGVSPTTIKRMVAEGMPSETWGMSRTRRFLPSQAMAWAAGRSRMRRPPGRRRQRARTIAIEGVVRCRVNFRLAAGAPASVTRAPASTCPPAPSSAAPRPTRPRTAPRRRGRGAHAPAHERPRGRHPPRVLGRLDDRPAVDATRRVHEHAPPRTDGEVRRRVRAPADPRDRRRARRRLDQGRPQPRHRPAPADVLQRRRHRPRGQARRPQPVREARPARQPWTARHDAARPGRDRPASSRSPTS